MSIASISHSISVRHLCLLRKWCLGFILILPFLFAGCQTGPVAKVGKDPSPDILRVGVAANMPPFVFKQNREIVGLEVDFARALGEELGREVRFVDMSWERLIPALQNNRIDIIMAGMNYTEERSAVILMTDPYLLSGQKALTLRRNVSKYPLPGLIANTRERVGAERGTTGEFLVEAYFPHAQLRTYSSPERGARAVASGEIELFIHDAPTIYWMGGVFQNDGVAVAQPVLTEDLMVWGINRSQPQLHRQVNRILAEWAEDGTTDEILSHWLNF